MKRIKSIVLTALLAVSSVSYAQFANSSSGSHSSSSGIDGWMSAWVEYNPIKTEIQEEDFSLTGFSGGVSRAFSISQDAPLLVETGVGIQYANGSKTISGTKVELDLLSAKVPINILFGIEVPNSNLLLFPFAGVTLRYNISGELKIKSDYLDTKSDVFDEDKMGEDNTFGRFQAYWQIGAKVQLGQLNIGVSYGKDFQEIWEKGESKLQTTSITLGYVF